MRPQAAAPSSWPANRAFLRFSVIGANGSLDRIAIDFDSAVIEEPRQPVTALEAVADDFGHFAALGQERQLLLQPTEHSSMSGTVLT